MADITPYGSVPDSRGGLSEKNQNENKPGGDGDRRNAPEGVSPLVYIENCSPTPDTFAPRATEREWSAEERRAYGRKKQALNNRRSAVARSLVGGSLAICGTVAEGVGAVPVYQTKEGRTVVEVRRCGSWACPDCGTLNAYIRQRELAGAILQAFRRGWSMVFLTLTVPHTVEQTTGEVVDAVLGCHRELLHRLARCSCQRKRGYAGLFRCLDFTFNPIDPENPTPETTQCHAHIHEVLFYEDGDVMGVAGDVIEQVARIWDGIVYKRCGKHPSRKHGFNVEPVVLPRDGKESAERLAEYASKVVADYSTTRDKQKGSLTPYDLLDDERYHALYKDWARGIRGRRFSYMTRGLGERLGVESYEPPERHQVGVITAEKMKEVRDTPAGLYDLRCSVADGVEVDGVEMFAEDLREDMATADRDLRKWLAIHPRPLSVMLPAGSVVVPLIPSPQMLLTDYPNIS